MSRCLRHRCANTVSETAMFYEHRFCTSCIREHSKILTKASNLEVGDKFIIGGSLEVKKVTEKNDLGIMYSDEKHSVHYGKISLNNQQFVHILNKFRKDPIV